MSVQLSFSPGRVFETIEYPGKVVNEKKMLQTLGGITKISQVLGDEKKRLELRFHQDNPYNKPAWGDATEKTAVILSVIVRRSKKDPTRPPEYYVRVLGHSSRIFAFESLCDFQYLPLTHEQIKPHRPPQLKFNLEKLMPQSITDFEYFKRTEVPLLSVPEVFARVDMVHTGIYRSDPQESGQCEVLGVLQKSTYDNRDVVAFSMIDPFPTNPDPQIVKRMKVKYVSDAQFERVKQLFDDCPIWTRIALLYESGVSNDKLKCIIPSLAYYYSTGPWRTLYVRYGYDPRKDFNSRHYQTFDFRLRFGSGVSEFVIRKNTMKKRQDASQNELVQDIAYPYFDEHKLPRSRQCILRYCDVRIQKIQDMLEKIPSPMTGAMCNERTGWLPMGFDTQVRQIVCNAIKELLRNHYRKENLNAEVEAVENAEDDEEEEDLDEEHADEEYDESPDTTHFLNKSIENMLNDMDVENE